MIKYLNLIICEKNLYYERLIEYDNLAIDLNKLILELHIFKFS